MKIQIYKIDNRDSCIKEIINLKSDNASDVLTHFVPPVGCPEIIIYMNQTQQIKNVECVHGFIKGQYTSTQKIDFQPGYHFLSLRLQPFGLKQLFNLHAGELQNAVLDIDELPTGRMMRKFISDRKILEPVFLKELIAFIDQIAIYPVSGSTLEFVKWSEQSKTKSIKDSFAEKNFSLRTLQRNFKREVGLTPKEFLKIARINTIEHKLAQNADVFQLIADFDFTDQSHLIKEFKQLRSNTPMDLKRKKLFLQDQLVIPEIVKI